MAELQVVFWRAIPAQVKARQGRARASLALSPRFQEAIDSAAMRAGLTDTDDYLEQWRSSAWEERAGTPEEVAELRAAEIERDYSDERLGRLVTSGGREL